MNECDLNAHDCNNNAECFNTNGSFVCNCGDGFSGNGVLCEGMQTTKIPLSLIQIDDGISYISRSKKGH